MGAAMNARERLRELAMWGDDRTADELLDDYAVEVARAERIATYRAAADEIEAEQQRIEAAERARFGFLDHETELQGAAVYAVAARLRARADQMGQQ
jgi:hypothetical protein